MVKIIARISRGTLMDQVYVPKNRPEGFAVGAYVALAPVALQKPAKPFFFRVRKLEPVKVEIVQRILEFADAENVIISGSFLDKGFRFNDVDILIINGKAEGIEAFIEEHFGLEAHVLRMSFRELRQGLNTDPLFQMLLSRYLAKKRVIFKIKHKYHYKLLDLHLLKSKALMESFEHLTGTEKYKMARNAAAISLFLDGKRVSRELADREIEHAFGKGSAKELIENTITRKFVSPFKEYYKQVFERIMEGIAHGPEQE